MTKFSVKKMEVSADFRGKISQNFVETVQTPGSEAESAKKKKKEEKKSHGNSSFPYFDPKGEELILDCWLLIPNRNVASLV